MLQSSVIGDAPLLHWNEFFSVENGEFQPLHLTNCHFLYALVLELRPREQQNVSFCQVCVKIVYGHEDFILSLNYLQDCQMLPECLKCK